MSLKDRSSFSGAGITAPNLNGAIASMNNIGNLITDEQKQRATAQQYAIQNKMMQDRLNIAQAAEQRAADTYQAKLADNKAINEALQNQVYNPEVLSGVEKVYENIDKNYEGQTKLDMYDKANAMMMPNDQLSAAITTPLSSQAYQQRVMGDLGNASPEARAQALALSKAMYPDTGYKYAKERAKAIADVNLATMKASNTAALGNKVTLKTGNTGGTSTSGTGSIGGKYPSYTAAGADFIKNNKILNNWNLNSMDASNIQNMMKELDANGGKLDIDGKEYKVSKSDVLNSLVASVDPNNNLLFSKGVYSPGFKDAIVKFAGKFKDKTNKSNTTKTVTLNTGAQARINADKNTALNNIARLYPTPTSKTPKDVVDKLFKGLFDKETKADITKRAKSISNQPVKQPYGSATLQVAMATPKGSADVAKLSINNPQGFAVAYEAATPAERNKIDKALTSKASKEYFSSLGKASETSTKNVVSKPVGTRHSSAKAIKPVVNEIPEYGNDAPYDAVKQQAVQDYLSAKNDNTTSEFDKGVRMLGNRALYATALVGQGANRVGNFLGNALVGLDNTGTAIGNFFRNPTEQKPYITLSDGKKFFTGDSKAQQEARAKVAASKSSVRSAENVTTLRKQAAEGKKRALKALQKQYPKASKAQLQIMLDNIKLNTLQTGVGYEGLSNLR